MTSLESGDYKQMPPQNFDQISPNNPNLSPMFLPSNGGNNTGYDSLEVQLFGPLPPYLMQGQQQAAGMGGMPLQQPAPTGLMGMTDDIYSQQARTAGTAGLNFNELFGNEDWTGLMDPSYRQ